MSRRVYNFIDTNHKFPLVMLNYSYNKFAPDAVDNGLLVIDSLDTKKIYDNADDEPLYTEHQLFSVALPIKKWNREMLPIYIGHEFWFGNTDMPDEFEIDFNDGNGYVTVSPGTVHEISWNNVGNYVVKVRFLKPDETIVSANTSVLKQAGVSIPPDAALGLVASTTWPGESGPARAVAWIKWGANNTSGKFCNPLIFVEGIDFPDRRPLPANSPNNYLCLNYFVQNTGYIPLNNFQFYTCGKDNFRMGNAGWNEMVDWNEEYKQLEKFPVLRTQLQQADYDVIYLDFYDGAGLIQNNAMVLVELLEWINNPANRNCSSEAIVMGASMGGQVSRFALSYMEQNNLCHNTKLYVSFDSPHRGANTPLGLQYMLKELEPFSNAARDNMVKLMRPASKQMLVYHLSSQADSYRNSWQGWQSSANSYPTQLRKVAVANGSRLGHSQGYNAGAMLIESSTWGILLTARHRSYSLPGTTIGNNSNVVYKKDRNGLLIPDVTKTVPATTPPYDSAPGCVGFVAKEFHENAPSHFDKNSIRPNSFMPTVSTLDVHAAGPISTANLFYDINTNILSDRPDPSKYRFDAYLAPANNEPHVQITDGSTAKYRDGNFYAGSNNIEWIMNELRQSERNLPSTLISLYNFGSPYRKILPTVTINNGGQLLVNNSAFVVSGGTGTQTNPSNGNFELTTTTCGTYVKVNTGGLFELGGTNVTTHQATVLFKTDSFLELNGGKLVINDNSRLVIEPGATLLMSQNSIIELNGDNAVLEIKGQLIVGPNTTFTFTSAPGQNTGFIKFALSASTSIEVTPTSHLKFEGKGITDKILEIAPGTWLTYTNWAMGSSEFKNGLVEMGDNSKVYLVHNVTVDNVHFNGINGLYNAVEAHATADKERISNSKFTNAIYGLVSYTHLPNLFRMSNNVFDGCDTGLKAYNSHIEINNCQFLNTHTGFEMNGGGSGEISNSLFDAGQGIVYFTANGILNLDNTIVRAGNDGLRFNGAGTIKGVCSVFSGNNVGIRAQNSAFIDFRKPNANITPAMTFSNYFDNIVLENSSGLNFENGANTFFCFDNTGDYNSSQPGESAGIQGTLIDDLIDSSKPLYNQDREFFGNNNQWNNINPPTFPVGFQDAASGSRFDYKIYVIEGSGPNAPKRYFKITDNNPRSSNMPLACNSVGGTGSRLSAAGLASTNNKAGSINTHSQSGSGTTPVNAASIQQAITQALATRKHQNTTGDDQQAFLILYSALQIAQPDTSLAYNRLIGTAYRLMREIYSASLISDTTTTPAAKLASMNQISDKVISWQQQAANYQGLFYTSMNKALDSYSSGELLQARAHLGSAIPLADSAGQVYAQYWNCLISANILLKDSTITMQQFFAMLDSCSGFNTPPVSGRQAAIGKKATFTKKPVQQEKPIVVYPNPSATGEAMLSYELKQDDEVTIELLDVKGNVVKTVQKQNKQKAGTHDVSISINDRPGGLYLVRVYGRHFNKQAKLVYQK